MKTEDAAAVAVEAPTASPVKPKRKAEATSDRLSNLSRVTSAQLAHISFPAESRYVPVRSIFASASTASTSTKARVSTLAPSVGSGGGILMMRDREPTKEGEFLEMEVTRVLQLDDPIVAPAAAAAAAVEPVDDGPIADLPPAFEYSDWD